MNGATDSERLREFIAERGMTQRALAAAVGVSAQYVQQLCTVRPVPDQFIGRLARTFGGAAAAQVAGGTLPAQVAARVSDPGSATGIAFPPVARYHEVARPGLYEDHLFDELLFDGDVAARSSGARRRWSVDELCRAMLVACGVLKGAAEAQPTYQAPAEQWYTPCGETCVAYGVDDAAVGD